MLVIYYQLAVTCSMHSHKGCPLGSYHLFNLLSAFCLSAKCGLRELLHTVCVCVRLCNIVTHTMCNSWLWSHSIIVWFTCDNMSRLWYNLWYMWPMQAHSRTHTPTLIQIHTQILCTQIVTRTRTTTHPSITHKSTSHSNCTVHTHSLQEQPHTHSRSHALTITWFTTNSITSHTVPSPCLY